MAILCVVRSQHLTEWLASTGIILFYFVCVFCRLTISPYDDEHTKTVSECPFKSVQPFGKCVFEAGPLTIYTEWTLVVFPLFCVLLWKENKEREKSMVINVSFCAVDLVVRSWHRRLCNAKNIICFFRTHTASEIRIGCGRTWMVRRQCRFVSAKRDVRDSRKHFFLSGLYWIYVDLRRFSWKKW